jgi:hypothetical protein
MKNNIGYREIVLLKRRNLLGCMVLLTALVSACLARTARANESARKRNLEDLGGLVVRARESLSGDACQEVMQLFQDKTDGIRDNPELIDTYLYMIEKSTDPDCIINTAEYLDTSIHSLKKTSIYQRKKIGNALARVLNDKNIHATWWRVQIGIIAPDLAKMGSPYKQMAHDWYIKDLKKLLENQAINDDARDEALGCVWNLLNTNSQLPTALLRKTIKKFDLIQFSKSSAATMNARSSAEQKKKHLVEMEQLLKRQ